MDCEKRWGCSHQFVLGPVVGSHGPWKCGRPLSFHRKWTPLINGFAYFFSFKSQWIQIVFINNMLGKRNSFVTLSNKVQDFQPNMHKNFVILCSTNLWFRTNSLEKLPRIHKAYAIKYFGRKVHPTRRCEPGGIWKITYLINRIYFICNVEP